MAQWLRPSEVARATGISTSTLRHYEKKGVLPEAARSPNGYREYPVGTTRRVRLVQKAIDFGFTLQELAAVLGVKDRGGRPCRRVRALAAAKCDALEIRIRELQKLRNDMKAMLHDWDRRLDHTLPGRRAHLLETLVGKDTEHDDTRTHLERSRSRSHPRDRPRPHGRGAAPARAGHAAPERLRGPSDA